MDLGMRTILCWMWWPAILFDFWTSLIGNIQLLTRGSFGIAAATAASIPTPTLADLLRKSQASANLSSKKVHNYNNSPDSFYIAK